MTWNAAIADWYFRVDRTGRPAYLAVDEDGWIAPGLIDVQVNGAGGADLTSADDPEATLDHVARTLAQHGVTAFCPTIVSSSRGVILDRLIAYRPRAGAPEAGFVR